MRINLCLCLPLLSLMRKRRPLASVRHLTCKAFQPRESSNDLSYGMHNSSVLLSYTVLLNQIAALPASHSPITNRQPSTMPPRRNRQGSGSNSSGHGRNKAGFQELDVVSKRPASSSSDRAGGSTSTRGRKGTTTSGRAQATTSSSSVFTSARQALMPSSSSSRQPPASSGARGRFKSSQQIGSEELAAKRIVPIPDLVFEELQECYPYGERRRCQVRDSLPAAIARGLSRYFPSPSIPTFLTPSTSSFLTGTGPWEEVINKVFERPSEDNLGSSSMSVFAHIEALIASGEKLVRDDFLSSPSPLSGEYLIPSHAYTPHPQRVGLRTCI